MKKTINLTKQQEQQLISELQAYFAEHLEPISNLQALLLLDFLLKTLGPSIYNVAINEAYEYLQTKLDDIFILEKHQ